MSHPDWPYPVPTGRAPFNPYDSQGRRQYSVSVYKIPAEHRDTARLVLPDAAALEERRFLDAIGAADEPYDDGEVWEPTDPDRVRELRAEFRDRHRLAPGPRPGADLSFAARNVESLFLSERGVVWALYRVMLTDDEVMDGFLASSNCRHVEPVGAAYVPQRRPLVASEFPLAVP